MEGLEFAIGPVGVAAAVAATVAIASALGLNEDRQKVAMAVVAGLGYGLAAWLVGVFPQYAGLAAHLIMGLMAGAVASGVYTWQHKSR